MKATGKAITICLLIGALKHFESVDIIAGSGELDHIVSVHVGKSCATQLHVTEISLIGFHHNFPNVLIAIFVPLAGPFSNLYFFVL